MKRVRGCKNPNHIVVQEGCETCMMLRHEHYKSIRLINVMRKQNKTPEVHGMLSSVITRLELYNSRELIDN